jgi:hypothetical protein
MDWLSKSSGAFEALERLSTASELQERSKTLPSRNSQSVRHAPSLPEPTGDLAAIIERDDARTKARHAYHARDSGFGDYQEYLEATEKSADDVEVLIQMLQARLHKLSSLDAPLPVEPTELELNAVTEHIGIDTHGDPAVAGDRALFEAGVKAGRQAERELLTAIPPMSVSTQAPRELLEDEDWEDGPFYDKLRSIVEELDS